MQHVKEYRNILSGNPGGWDPQPWAAVVMGGGPSLLVDVKTAWVELDKRKINPVYIAVNFHALAIGLYADYMVFGDQLKDVPTMRPFAESFEGVKVSRDPITDVYLDPEYCWLQGGHSGTLAAWWGCYLGCDPVLLAGMDCYQGPVKYCHDLPVPDHPCREYPLKSHLRAWGRVLKYCPGAERIRAISGPTVEIFGKWEPLCE